MGDIDIRGGREAREIARAFEKAAAGDLSRELQRALEDGAEPLVDAAHRAALLDLPKRGGLNRVVARARITVRSYAGRNPAVKIVASGIDQLYRIDKAGKVDHPTYGHRPRVTQSIPRAEGWFTDTMRDGAPRFRRELERALDRVARRIARSG